MNNLILDTEIRREIYLGFILDAINHYLQLNAREYLLSGGGALMNLQSGKIELDSGTIYVSKTETLGIFLVRNFPEEKDFLDFREKAPGILQRLLNQKVC